MKTLRDMEVFAAVGEFHSFGRAAEQLGMPTSTLSRRVSGMEQELGVRLIDRTTRKLRLTSEGAAYLVECQDLMKRARSAQDHVRGMVGALRGGLKIGVSDRCMMAQVVAKVATFCERYPEIEVQLERASNQTDLVGSGADLALWVGQLEDSSLVARPIFEVRRILCATPDYLRGRARVAQPQDLAELRAIRLFVDARHPIELIHPNATSPVLVRPGAKIIGYDEAVVAALVSAGSGFGLLDGFGASEALRAGALVQLLPDWSPAPLTVFAVTTTKVVPERVRVFVDFLRAGFHAESHVQPHRPMLSHRPLGATHCALAGQNERMRALPVV